MAINATLVLFSNQDAAGNGSDVKVNIGGTYNLIAQATWGAASHKLQIKGPNGTGYIDVSGSTMTADGVVSVDLAGGATVRGVVTGTPTDLYSELRLVG